MHIESPEQLRVATSIERSYYSLKSAIAMIGRSAMGRADMVDTKRVLADIKIARDKLDKFERDCLEFSQAVRETRTRERAENRNLDRRLQTYIARAQAEGREDVVNRARKLNLIEEKVVVAPPPQLQIVAASATKKRTGLLAIFPNRAA